MFADRIKQIIFSGTDRSRTVKLNIIGSLAIKMVSVAVQMLLVPITLGYVSAELYGIWLALSSLVLWLGFFDIGFTMGLKNKLTEALAKNDYERGKSLVSTTYVLMACLFLPLMLVFEVANPHIPWHRLLNVAATYRDAITQTMSILISCFCLQMIVSVFSTVVAAYQKVALSSLFPVLGNIISLVVIFILVKTTPPSLPLLGLAISVAPVVIIGLASVYFYGSAFRAVRPAFQCFDRALIKDIFGLGVKFFLINIQMLVMFQATNIIISNVASPVAVSSYNVAYKLFSVAMLFFNIMIGPIWPAFTDAYVKRDFAWMNAVYRKMLRIVAALFALLVVAFFLSPYIYHLWVGDKVTVSTVMSLCVALYVMLLIWNSLHTIIVNGIGAVRLQTIASLVGMTFYIPLSFYLGKQLGAEGVVVSMIIIYAVYCCVFTTQVHKLMNHTAAGIWTQ